MKRFATWLGTAWIACAVVGRAADNLTPVHTQPASTNLVAELTKLLKAKSPTPVMREFVANWSTPYLTSVDDMVLLKSAGADPELLNAYARRGAELRLQAAQHASPRPNSENSAGPTVILYPVPAQNYSWSDSVRPEVPYYFSQSLGWWGEAYGGAWLGPWLTPWWQMPWGTGWAPRGHLWR